MFTLKCAADDNFQKGERMFCSKKCFLQVLLKYFCHVTKAYLKMSMRVLTLPCGSKGPHKTFHLNDMLNLWPDLCRIPHDAQQQAAAAQQQPGQQLQQHQQQQQRPLKRQTPCAIAVCCMFLCLRHGKPSVTTCQ